MKIRTQFLITMVLFGLVLLMAAGSIVITNLQVERLQRQAAIAQAVERGARSLSYLSNDYLLFGESQQRTRWEEAFAAFSQQVARLAPATLDQQALVINIRANQARLQATFADAAATIEQRTASTGAASSSADLDFIRISSSRMAVQNQGIVFGAVQLTQQLNAQVEQVRQVNRLVIFILLGAFAAYFITNYVLVYRHTLRSIAGLQQGTQVIGSGDLDFVLPEGRADEIGALAQAFNRMSANLKAVTASRAELEQEIAERQRIAQERERLLAQVQAQAQDLQVANEVLQNQSEEMEIQAEELRSQNEELMEAQQLLNESDLRFRIALIQSGVSVFSQDRQLRYTWDHNPHPYFSAIDRIGKTDADLYSMTDAACLDALKRRVLDSGKELRQEVWLTFGEAATCYDLVLMPLRTAQGEINGLIGSALDITERKKAEAAIQSYMAQLVQSNQELQQFAFVASHDLQEPLRKIVTFSQLIGERSPLEEAERDYLYRMQNAAQRMQRMINDLLELSRITTHQKPYEPVDLNQVANEVMDDLEERIHRSHGQVVLQPLPVLEADPVQMHQLLQNLVGNALKFYRPDVPPVVEVGCRDLAPGKVEIYVRDNGIGFEMSFVDQIFLPFKRLHGRNEYEGSGIGLAVCQKIVERHGGQIEAHSAPGEGATFSVVLPVRQGVG